MCYHLCYHFYGVIISVIIWCYHFSRSANVIIFMLLFSLLHILCYHLCYHLMLSFTVIISPLFSFSWKRDTLVRLYNVHAVQPIRLHPVVSFAISWEFWMRNSSDLSATLTGELSNWLGTIQERLSLAGIPFVLCYWLAALSSHCRRRKVTGTACSSRTSGLCTR